MGARDEYERMKFEWMELDKKAKKAHSDWLLAVQRHEDGGVISRLAMQKADFENRANEARQRAEEFARRNGLPL